MTDDPASNVTLPDGEPRIALSYDWTARKWLPVPFKWVDPGGARYAYTDSHARIHLVAVNDGSDHVVASGETWGLYTFAADGIYAGQRDPSKQPSLRGLWRIPATGGTPELLASQGTWLAIGGGAAWSVVENGAPPLAVPENSVGNVLTRLDLQTGQTATWYSNAGGRFRVAALDSSGRPVLVGVDARSISIVTSVGSAQSVSSASAVAEVMADSFGVWFVDPILSSVELIQGGAVRYMGQYGSGGTMRFAGPCQ